MKKKVFGVLISLCVAASAFPMTVAAETFQGEAGKWTVNFTQDKVMDSTFKTSDMDETISYMQPGDTAVFEVSLSNSNSVTTDWYMTNKVLYSLEDRSSNEGTAGGAYSYKLTYTDSTGAVTVLFDSDTVGGEGITEAGEGLHQATDGLEDFFYLDTLENGQGGKVDLTVSLDGESQGNDYQDTLADLQMNFAVMMREEATEEGPTPPDIIRTGDEKNMTPFFIVAAVLASVLIALGVIGIKDRKKQQKGGVA